MFEVAGTGSPLSFAISRAGAEVVVALEGALDRAGVEALTPVMRDLIDYQGNQSVAVDLRGVSHADPSAAALFRDGLRWAQRHRTSFRVHDPAAVVAHLLTTCPANLKSTRAGPKDPLSS